MSKHRSRKYYSCDFCRKKFFDRCDWGGLRKFKIRYHSHITSEGWATDKYIICQSCFYEMKAYISSKVQTNERNEHNKED